MPGGASTTRGGGESPRTCLAASGLTCGKIKLLQKTRNEAGMLLKTKGRLRKNLERTRNLTEIKRFKEKAGMS